MEITEKKNLRTANLDDPLKCPNKCPNLAYFIHEPHHDPHVIDVNVIHHKLMRIHHQKRFF